MTWPAEAMPQLEDKRWRGRQWSEEEWEAWSHRGDGAWGSAGDWRARGDNANQYWRDRDDNPTASPTADQTASQTAIQTAIQTALQTADQAGAADQAESNAVVLPLRPPPGLDNSSEATPLRLGPKYTMEQLRAMPAMTQRGNLNSVALKWMRDTNEHPPGFPSVEYVDITDEPTVDICRLVRGSGPLYSFDLTHRQPWSWLAMIKGFKEELQLRIVGEGLANIRCMPIAGTYDHKRHKAKVDSGQSYPADAPVPIWDFVVTQCDGKKVRFHPNLKCGQVTISSMAHDLRATPPTAGKGKSDGKGTFRAMVNQAYPDGHVSSREPRPQLGGKGSASDAWQ